jgi:hypothetical protein
MLTSETVQYSRILRIFPLLYFLHLFEGVLRSVLLTRILSPMEG